MSLSDEQWEFAKDVQKLLYFLVMNDYKFTFGEAYRTKEQQEIYIKTGKSKTMNSKHMEKKAIDLNIWVKGVLTYKVEDLQPIGDFWKSLNPKNVWGGDWGWDSNHYQRN